MRLYTTGPIFALNCLDDSSELRVIKDFFAQLPDANLLFVL